MIQSFVTQFTQALNMNFAIKSNNNDNFKMYAYIDALNAIL